MSEVPSITNRGLTFFPVPQFSDPEIVFGADIKSYFPNRYDLPEVPSEWVKAANDLFYKGGHLPDLDPRVDPKAASRAVRAWLASWGPAHEQKEATVAYAFWVWTSKEALDAAE